MDDDKAYYRRRATAEWLAVAAADCDQARIAHAELAKWYVQLASLPSNVFLMKFPEERISDGSCSQLADVADPIRAI